MNLSVSHQMTNSQGRRMGEKQFDRAAWLVKEIGFIFWNHLEKHRHY